MPTPPRSVGPGTSHEGRPTTAPSGALVVVGASLFDEAPSALERVLVATREVGEVAIADARAAARAAGVVLRHATFAGGVGVFATSRVLAATLRALYRSPANRPWYAVYPDDWPSPTWLVRLPKGSKRDDVATPTPLAESLLLGRTLPRSPCPERWPEPLRRAWLSAHTTAVRVPQYRRYRHAIILGSPGAGKTARWIVRGIVADLAGAGHILTVDVKGVEQFRLLASAAQRAGVWAVCLDAWASAYTLAIEPLGSATARELEVLADALYGPPARGGSDDFWDAYARAYLRFLLAVTALFPRAARTVPCAALLATEETARVTALADVLLRQYRAGVEGLLPRAVAAALVLAEADEAAIDNPAQRSGELTAALELLDRLPHAVLSSVWELRARRARGGRIEPGDARHIAVVVRQTLGEHCERLIAARRGVRELERVGMEKLAANTRATLAAHLRAFTLPEVARFFSRPEVNLWNYASSHQRTLLCVGKRLGQGTVADQVAGLVVRLALHSVRTRNERADDDPVKLRPVWGYLDEVAQLRLPTLPADLAVLRSMNCGLMLVAQDLSQLRALYGEEAVAIETMCHVAITLDGLEDAVAERVAARCGKAHVTRRVRKGTNTHPPEVVEEDRARVEPWDLRTRRINQMVRRDAAFQAAAMPHWFRMPDPFFDDPEIRTTLGLVESGGRWVPGEPPAPIRDVDVASAATHSPRTSDPYAEIVLGLLGPIAGAPLPPLSLPVIPWVRFGMPAEEDDEGAGQPAASSEVRLLPPEGDGADDKL